MQKAHALCLPSVRESGGAVLLEAMSSARPVIALDYGGPAEIVNAQVGALVAMQTPEQVTADLYHLLIDIFEHPALWEKRPIQARKEAEEKIHKMYDYLLKNYIINAAAASKNVLLRSE